MGYVTLAIDFILLGSLVFAVYYIRSLMHALKSFNDAKRTMEPTLAALSHNVDAANQAIANLSAMSQNSSGELRKLVSDARGLSDELQLMIEAGDNLASRIETLVEQASTIRQNTEQKFEIPEDDGGYEEDSRAVFESYDDDDDESDVDEGEGYSRAEQDLLSILEKKKSAG